MTAYELRISDWSSDVCSSDLEEFADDPEDEEIVAQIRELIDTRVRPAVANDGGDIIYRGFDKGTVYLRMQGACSGCPSSTATLKNGIEQLLKHYEIGSASRREWVGKHV